MGVWGVSMANVFIVNSSHSYEQMFIERGWNVVEDIGDADLVQFTGGSDVDPIWYGHKKHHTTHSNSKRDVEEEAIFLQCIANGVPMAGICRGGQFLHVMNGGEMFQDVDNHAIYGTHKTYDISESYPKSIQVTSTHHQMISGNGKMEVLLVAELARHKIIYDTVTETFIDNGDYQSENEMDIEACFYRASNCLCFQPHPEMVEKEHECQEWYFNTIKKLFKLG